MKKMINKMITITIKKWKKYFNDFQCVAGSVFHNLRAQPSLAAVRVDHLRQWDFPSLCYCWGGVGWGGIITFMFLYTHRHGQALLFHHQLLLGWGGVGWDNNVHVPVHTQAQQQALLFHHQLLLGWGGGVLLAMCSYVRCSYQYA